MPAHTPDHTRLLADFNAAVAHLHAGRSDLAIPLLRAVHEAMPGEFEPLAYLAEALGHAGDAAAARPLAERAAAMRPDDPEGWALVARAAKAQGDSAGEAGALERAAAARPREPERWLALIECHFRALRYTSALAAVERALVHRPGAADLLARRAACHTGLGDVPAAIAALKGVVRAEPAAVEPAMGMANLHAYWHEATGPQVLEAHRAMGRVVERAAGRAVAARDAAPPADRPARVGLLSPDFRRHSVAYFVRPILRHLDRGKVELICLSTARHRDAENAALRQLAGEGHWHDLGGLEQREIAARVADAHLDLLVDLAGNTENNNLVALAARPAAAIATYLGSPMTTGLKAVRWRVVDWLTDPAPEADKLVVERLVRLERCFVCFEPPEGTEVPGPERSGSDGQIVFGSFNALMKLNPACLGLWRRVLDAVPGSRLVLKVRSTEAPEVAAGLRARLRAAGLDEGRVSLSGGIAERRGHLAAYGGVDVALDTTPYCGTTTTCEALLMGVPVVSLAGRGHAGRVGVSLLTAAGHAEWAARDEAEYVRVAAEVAAGVLSQRGHGDGARARLRAEFLASPVCDGPGFARAFEGALLAMVAESRTGGGRR